VRVWVYLLICSLLRPMLFWGDEVRAWPKIKTDPGRVGGVWNRIAAEVGSSERTRFTGMRLLYAQLSYGQCCIGRRMCLLRSQQADLLVSAERCPTGRFGTSQRCELFAVPAVELFQSNTPADASQRCELFAAITVELFQSNTPTYACIKNKASAL